MIIILLFALVFTHVLQYANKLVRKEGMENKKNKEGLENNDEEEADEKEVEEETDEKKMAEETDDANTKDDDEDVKKKKETYDMLKNDFDEFQSIQKNILNKHIIFCLLKN